MVNRRVVITSNFLFPEDEIDARLREAGLEPVYNPWHGKRTEGELIDLLQGMSAAIASIDPFTNQVFDASPELRVVARTGVGYDSVDVAAASAHNVAVCTTPGANNNAVAEFAFALIMTCARRVVENLEEVRAGHWKRHAGLDLAGSTLGIVGLGAIGKDVARKAAAFGMKVLAYDIYQDGAFAAANGVSYISLEDLLAQSDFVTLHCFLAPSTHHMINTERLALMKPTAYLINTSRGPVIDQEALYQALKERTIAGAALDVFEKEPLEADSPLRTLDNALLFPHVASNSAGAIRNMGMMAAENVIRILRGEKPLHAVNPEVLKF